MNTETFLRVQFRLISHISILCIEFYITSIVLGLSFKTNQFIKFPQQMRTVVYYSIIKFLGLINKNNISYINKTYINYYILYKTI